MNDRFGKGKSSNMHRATAAQNQPGSIVRRDQAGNEYVTPGKKEDSWMKMRSVTEQDSLNEFLSTAELAGTDFTAEKMSSVKIIHSDQKNPYLLSRDEERGVVRKQNAKRARLTVPRRPKWDAQTTRTELDERERQSLLEWRRGLAELQEVDDLLMTPFERNLEVWRQLWRVIERSDLVVQIVDARNPLLFRCEDLERYVKEVDPRKKNLLLVNKADMMTAEQRREWATYFMENGINFRFFSAEIARAVNEARTNGFSSLSREPSDSEDGEEDDEEIDEEDVEEEIELPDEYIAKKVQDVDIKDEEDEEEGWEDEEAISHEGDPDDDPHARVVRFTDDEHADDAAADPPALSLSEQVRILTTFDLEDLFLAHAPRQARSRPGDPDDKIRKTQIGLVGYPNVGKSSTINALLGSKKVSVSATPGKTKHFQTIHLSDKVILCDCPGLVFPNFATTKAELVCNGVLPIDQLREYSGPAALVAQRIPKPFLEAVYGMNIETRPIEEGGTGVPTGEEMLRAYARARGFMTQGLGQPDESRAARSVLKDYVKGKLLFCHPPPHDPPVDGREFNRDLYDINHLPVKRRAHAAASELAHANGGDLDDDISLMSGSTLPPPAQGGKSSRLDSAFFAPGQGQTTFSQPFHHKYTQQGKELSGRKAKMIAALEKDVDPADLKMGSKKHHKGGKRAKGKVRGVQGKGDYD
jgi:large subunit GTPase 1